jgi:uncharacterized membrane protein YedE/YeeE
MPSTFPWSGWPIHLSYGLAAGMLIVFVDNFAFHGEVSPIVIVAMLFSASACAGAIWGRRASACVALAWACLPSAHLIKQILGLPDTLHPNTYRSILYLALFSLSVAIGGLVFGVWARAARIRPASQASKPD